MKIIKRITLTILILTAIGLFFRGWFYRQLVTYKSVGLRASYSATDDKLVSYINASADKYSDRDIEQIIKLGLSITSAKLNFTAHKNNSNPNILITSKTAHCVGYASFFATTCNYLLKKYELDHKWIAKPQVGQLYFLGTNVHQYFKIPFLKDHDFATIENKISGQVFAVDPTISDYLLIDFVTYSQ